MYKLSLGLLKFVQDSVNPQLVETKVFYLSLMVTLMVSALDSRSKGLGLSLGQGTALCSWGRHFTLTVPHFTQVYKMGTGEFNGGGKTSTD